MQNQGWAKIDNQVESAVVTKVFGISESTTPSQRVWDNADYQQPPKVSHTERGRERERWRERE